MSFHNIESQVERATPKRCRGLTTYGSNELNEHGRDPPVAADVSATYSFGRDSSAATDLYSGVQTLTTAMASKASRIAFFTECPKV